MAPRADQRRAVIRTARLDDARRISELMAQLGYDVCAPDVAIRLARRGKDREVFVAEDDAGVVGWAGVCIEDGFVGGRYAGIEGFVVDAETRGAGLGAQLLEAVEVWARARNCDAMRVQSNVVRERAHAFYERHGYVKLKAQYALRKAL